MMTQLLTNVQGPQPGQRQSRFSLSVRLLSLLLVGLFCLSTASPTLVLAQEEGEEEGGEEDLGYDDMGNPIESAATKDPPKYVLPYVALGACLTIGIFAVCMSSKRKYAFSTGEYRTTNLLEMEEEHAEDKDKKTVRARGGKGRKKLKK